MCRRQKDFGGVGVEDNSLSAADATLEAGEVDCVSPLK